MSENIQNNTAASAQPRPKTPNDIINKRVKNHPATQFDESVFIDLLEHSLSLSTYEKKRIIDNIPNLSSFQINELMQVFEDERSEFRKLIATEGEIIKGLVIKAQNEWEHLKDIYREEEEHAENEKRALAQKEADEQKAEEIRKNLGL